MQHTSNSEIRYITSHEFENLWNLKVNTVGFESISALASYPTAGHPQEYSFNFEQGRILQEFQLVYITKGSGQFVSRHCPIRPISEGSVFFLFPGEWHSYQPEKETGWESYWLGFDGLQAAKLLESKLISPENPVVEIGYDEEIVSLCNKILEISKSEHPAFQQFLSGMLVHLLAYFLYREKNKSWSDKEVLTKMEKARLIMREKFNTSISPEDIARMLNMSYTWFRRMFKQYTGLAPAQYLMQLKIQKAKELLTLSDLPIKEIAIELGYESIDYFSTSFKRQTQLTPGEFRNTGKGKILLAK